MNNQTTRIWTTLRYLAVIPLIALGILSILASGSSGGGDTPGLTSSSDAGPFDDFSAAMIDPTKWADLEFVRQVDNGVLQLALARRQVSGNARSRLDFINPAAVSAIQADVTVTAVSNTNATPRARVAGYFYDDGTPGGGEIGEVFAGTEIRHDGTQLVVALRVFLCGNFDCSGGTTILFDTTTFGPVAVGETHTLSVAWDGGTVFTYGFDGNTVSFDTLVPVAGPSQIPFKAIGTRVTGIAGPDEGAFIAATFDNVMVNGNPYDDFSAAMIDRTKWVTLEFVRQVNNGVLESALTRFGSAGSNNLNFINPAAVSAIQADVTVTEVINTDATPRARLAGFWYNDGTGTPGTGAIGDVFADINIRHDGTQLVVNLQVFLCGDFGCFGGTTLLFDSTTFGPVAVGETHTLSLVYDGGTVFTFGFDGNTVSFDTPVPFAGPPQRTELLRKRIGTRVTGIAGPDEGAFIAATFDNVVVTQPPPRLLVASGFGDAVPRYDASTGAFLGDFVPAGSGGLDSPRGLAIGPDGNLYVVAGGTADAVLRYDGGTGAFIDAFVTGLINAFGLVFGPDGNLYVSELSSAEVLRFNGTTGVFIDTFVPAGSGGLGLPRDLLFGPDGNLYVSSAGSLEVLRYNGTTGAFIDVFASGVFARGLVFGPDGNLYVASFASDDVRRFNGTTGAFIDIFSAGNGLDGPVGVAFGPDGNLYVASFESDEVKRYDGTTGAFIDTFVTVGSGGLDAPRLMLFVS